MQMLSKTKDFFCFSSQQPLLYIDNEVYVGRGWGWGHSGEYESIYNEKNVFRDELSSSMVLATETRKLMTFRS